MVQKRSKSLKVKIRNSFMKNGLSYVSEILISKLLKDIQYKTKKDHRLIFKLALKNILVPVSNVTVRKRKYTVIVPFFLKKKNRILKTIKNIGSINKFFFFKDNVSLSNEIIKLSTNKGKLKNNFIILNKQIFINKNFTYYRWFL
jgi:ribosomal protein S7